MDAVGSSSSSPRARAGVFVVSEERGDRAGGRAPRPRIPQKGDFGALQERYNVAALRV
jgi:hypothetical protein